MKNVAVPVAALAVALAQGESVTPVEKVISLLKGMAEKLESESTAEAATYDKFACYCKDTTKEKSDSIKSGQDSIDVLSAEIAEKTADKAAKTTSLQENNEKLEKLNAFLKETEVRCAKEKADYQARDADLVKAITSLESAKEAMETSKPGAAKAGLLTVQAVLKTNPRFEQAMKLMDDGPKWAAFLQSKAKGGSKAKVDPNDPEYKYHSQGIIDMLIKLHEDFTAEKATADSEFAKAEASCTKTQADTSEEIGLTEETIADLTTNIGTLTERLAAARVELVEADNVLKDDKLYMTDLTAICEKRAHEYDQRSAMRGKEHEALTSAIGILEGKVAGVEGERAMLVELRKAGNKAVSFFQKSVVSAHVQEVAKVETVDAAAQSRMEAAMNSLRIANQRLKSSSLNALLARAGSDPFAKVKGLIQKLVERLIQEATEEATKKGFCDTELAKAKKDRDFRLAEVNTLSAEIGGLETKNDELELEIKELTKALEELDLSAKEAAEQREEQKEENAKALADARGGLEAVTEALGILQTFYKQAAKATALVQTAASPIDEDNPGAGFDGAYKGNQAESKGVIGLLEVIKTDFEHTIEITTETEKTQASDFVKFDRTTKADIGGKSTKKKLDEEDLATTKASLEQKTKDMKSNMDLVDASLMELEELAPTCVDNVQSYEDRVAKREEEIAALKTALCQLDAEGVEEECQK